MAKKAKKAKKPGWSLTPPGHPAQVKNVFNKAAGLAPAFLILGDGAFVIASSDSDEAIPTVIPGRCVASNPESRDSGSGPSDHPGMTRILRSLLDR
jgi:hypothetical protein